MLKNVIIHAVLGSFLVFAVSIAGAMESTTPSLKVSNGIMGGSGCGGETSVLLPDVLTEEALKVEIATEVLKLGTERLKRSSCSFAIPVKIAAGKRLVLRDLKVPAFISLARGASGEANLEIFAAGRRGERVVFKQKAAISRITQEVLFEKDGVLFKSACGEAINLRGNISALLKDGIQRSMLILDAVELKVEIEECK